MVALNELKNTTRPKKRKKRVGRGPGSGMGKTSTRGQKGAGSRSGYKRRLGTEGGRVPLYKKIPTRGFSRGRFAKDSFSLTFTIVDKIYSDGEVVSKQSLYEKRVIPKKFSGKVKLLLTGTLTKKVTFEVDGYSKQAEEYLVKQSIKYVKPASAAEG